MKTLPRTLRLATRGSALALAQTQLVCQAIERVAGADIAIELVVVHTSADRAPDRPLREFGDKALFVKEIEEAILAGRADAGVHSLKDLPALLPDRLIVAATLEREDTRDVLITRNGLAFAELPPAATVATSSLRRRAQLARLRPDLTFVDVRGNVDTRLRKLQRGDFDALILAAAGLRRLGLMPDYVNFLSHDEVLPAAGQGAIAVEAPADSPFKDVLELINHVPTFRACEVERLFVRSIGADCHSAVGCLCEKAGRTTRFRAVVCSPDGSRAFSYDQQHDDWDDATFALDAAERLIAQGAESILELGRDPRWKGQRS